MDAPAGAAAGAADLPADSSHPADAGAQGAAARAEREAAFDAEVARNLKRNFIANYIHGMLGMTGFRVIYAPTLIPAYLLSLGGSPFVVGLGQSLLQVGAIASPVVSASILEHRRRILPVAVRIGTMMRVQILGMAVAGLLMAGVPLLVATLAFLFLLGIFQGMQRVAFQMIIAKVIPIARRGRLQAWRNITGGAIAALLSYAAGIWLIEPAVLGNGYAATFLAAFVLTSFGLLALQFGVREPDAPEVRQRMALRQRMRDMPALLADGDYRWFVIAQGLAIAGRLAAPFYILAAGRVMAIDGQAIGLLSLAFLGADTVSNLLWGYWGDRSGYRLTFIAATACTIAGVVLLLLAGGAAMVVAAFCAFGAGLSGYMMSASTMVLEFGAREDMPMRIAFSTTVEGTLAAIGPLVGGLVVAIWGTGTVLALSCAFLVLSAAILVFKVREPRRRPQR